ALRSGDKGLEAGAMFPKLPTITYGEHHVTVAIFLNTRCIACRQSAADYAALGELASNTGNGMVLVCAVFGGESDIAIADAGFRLPMVQVRDFREYGISGTPTVVAIDSTGKVRDFWIGKLSEGAKANLMRLIKEALNA